MNNFKDFWNQYRGAIIGVIIAILILITRLDQLILAIVVLFLGAFIGNYVQRNKEDVTTRVELDKDNNVNVYANLVVSSEAVIKDLSAKLQTSIKDKIKKATDLDVNEVNITVKKVAEKQQEE